MATFKFGCDSDTLDTTGNVENNVGHIPTAEQIREVLSEFVGEIMQIPPKYSAKNIDGKRGYELARAGVEFDIPPKKVTIYSVELKENISDDSYTFEIECGGGTYIRSIARDLGKRLSTCAIMSALTRTQSGVFTLGNSVCTANLTRESIEKSIIPTESVLSFDSIYPTERQAFKLFNGLSVESDKPDGIYKIYKDGFFYGLAEIKHSILKVRTKLC